MKAFFHQARHFSEVFFPVAGQHKQALFSYAVLTCVTVNKECGFLGLEGTRF